MFLSSVIEDNGTKCVFSSHLRLSIQCDLNSIEVYYSNNPWLGWKGACDGTGSPVFDDVTTNADGCFDL